MTPFAIGMSEVSYLRFTLLNIIGAGIWAIAIASAGYYFGQAVVTVLGDIKKYELEVMAAIVVLASLVWFIHVYRQRSSKQRNTLESCKLTRSAKSNEAGTSAILVTSTS